MVIRNREDKAVRLTGILAFALLVGGLAACSSPEDDKAKAQEGAAQAQEEIARERLDLVEKYKTCVSEASGDQLKVEACNSYLKAAQALQ